MRGILQRATNNLENTSLSSLVSIISSTSTFPASKRLLLNKSLILFILLFGIKIGIFLTILNL